ncbi:MAG: HlyD family secretion protein [Alphaproteobacteria bacterium]|nr:HlyD family secretion protein [Alphaproteobacteria bacterium]
MRNVLRRAVRFAMLVVLPMGALAAAGTLWLAGGRTVGTDNAYVRTPILSVAAEISGPVAEVLVRENESVAAGQALLRIQPETFRIQLAKAEADLAKARTEIEVMKATHRQRLEEVRLAQTRLDFAEREHKRQADLAARAIVAATTLDRARNDLDLARQDMAVLRQQAATIAAGLGGNADAAVDTHPLVREARARRDQAALDLARTEVKAPFAGVAQRLPEPGAYVRAGQPAMSLVGATRPWIEANMKETDLTHVRTGQAVRIVIDTYPGREWRGRVESLSRATGAEFSLLPPQNASGNWVKVVQRLPVRIAIEAGPDDAQLRSGLSAVIEIETGQRRSIPVPVKEALARAGLLPRVERLVGETKP